MAFNTVRILSSKQLNKLPNGKFTVNYPNPNGTATQSYLGLPNIGTPITGDKGNDTVLSIQAGSGEVQTRPKGTDGGYEVAEKSGGFLLFKPTDGEVYPIPVVD